MPKISHYRIQYRLVDRDLRHPQMAEQLVEVPIVLSLSLLRQLSAEQIVDIPVRRGRGDRVVEVFEVFSQNRIQLRLLSRSLAFHVAVEVFKVYAQDRVQRRFPELNTKFKVFAQDRSGAEHSAHEGFLSRQGSTAFAWGRTS